MKTLSVEELRTEIKLMKEKDILFPRHNDKLYDYNIFSNFVASSRKIIDEFGIEYKTVENYYQANKTLEIEIRKEFTTLEPNIAKKIGSMLYPKDWHREKKYLIMREGLRQKFEDEEFKRILLSTQNNNIIEYNWWKDSIWGYDAISKFGSNALGKLLMELRDNILLTIQ